MKRRFVIKLCIFLLLGAVVNVAVAWGCAYWCTIRSGPTQDGFLGYGADELSDRTNTWFTTTNANGTSRLVYSYVTPTDYQSPDPVAQELRDRFLHGVPRISPPEWATSSQIIIENGGRAGYARATGWPLLCAYSTYHWVGDTYQSLSLQAVDSSALVFDANSPPGRIPTSVPLRFIWPGFAINTLFYAVILWPLFAAPGRVRRWRRVRRGLCVKCAYPVGTSDVCTECGEPVRVTSVEPILPRP